MSISGSSTELIVYNYLRVNLGYNIAVACGILANINYESSFNPRSENKAEGAYGLCQWRLTRKTDLIDYCKKNNLDYSSVSGQLNFMKYELSGSEKAAGSALSSIADTVDGARSAAEIFCNKYERAATGEDVRRKNAAAAAYPQYAAEDNSFTSVQTVGRLVSDKALSVVGNPIVTNYEEGVSMSTSFDSARLVYYSYNEAGHPIPDMTVEDYESKYVLENTPKTYNLGDLIFWTDSSGTRCISIVSSSNAAVSATRYRDSSSPTRDTVANLAIADIVRYNTGNFRVGRILSDTQSVSTSSPVYYGTYRAYIDNDPYVSIVTENIGRVDEAGYDYGYLIDMTNGGEFKFYVPEFIESAGANWETVNIIGRSASVIAYSNTSSRVISISLDLYAGVGLYVGKDLTESVSKLHQDANFLKSLEYPDYTNPIARPPATVHLLLGSAVNMIGVVSDVTIEHLKPLDSQNRSMYLRVSFKVTQIASSPADWVDVRNNQYALAATNNVS